MGPAVMAGFWAKSPNAMRLKKQRMNKRFNIRLQKYVNRLPVNEIFIISGLFLPNGLNTRLSRQMG
jgi:hypothetical protein